MRKISPQSRQRDFFPASAPSSSYCFLHPGQFTTMIMPGPRVQALNADNDDSTHDPMRAIGTDSLPQRAGESTDLLLERRSLGLRTHARRREARRSDQPPQGAAGRSQERQLLGRQAPPAPLVIPGLAAATPAGQARRGRGGEAEGQGRQRIGVGGAGACARPTCDRPPRGLSWRSRKRPLRGVRNACDRRSNEKAPSNGERGAAPARDQGRPSTECLPQAEGPEGAHSDQGSAARTAKNRASRKLAS